MACHSSHRPCKQHPLGMLLIATIPLHILESLDLGFLCAFITQQSPLDLEKRASSCLTHKPRHSSLSLSPVRPLLQSTAANLISWRARLTLTLTTEVSAAFSLRQRCRIEDRDRRISRPDLEPRGHQRQLSECGHAVGAPATR